MTDEERRLRKNELQRIWYRKNHEKALEIHRKYRETHGSPYLKYIKANPEKYEMYKKNHAKVRRDANAKSKEECDKDKYHREWTLAEINFLCENYYTMTIPEIAKAMGRTIPSIERKRNRLGLNKGGKGHHDR